MAHEYPHFQPDGIMYRTRVALVCVLTTTALIRGNAHGQAPSPRAQVLGPTFKELGEPFSNIGELAELPDGRVLVTDFRENRVLLADFNRQTLVDAARVGSGPLEFRGASPMVRGPKGQVWAWDVAQDRVLIFDSSGKPTGTKPAGVQGSFGMLPSAVDSAGVLYGEYRGWRRENGSLVQEDSTAIIRKRVSRSDTIALIHPLRAPHRTARDRLVVRATGFAPQDAWGVFDDGSILLIRGATYSPVIISPSGARSLKPAIPFPVIPVTAADRRQQIQELEQLLTDARRKTPSESATRIRVSEPLRWATTKPPVRASMIRVDSRQRGWVSVYDALDSTGTRYDLLDRNARRVGAVRIPLGEQLVGFGRNALYTARRDSDDLVYLRRYPLP